MMMMSFNHFHVKQENALLLWKFELNSATAAAGT